MIPNAESHPGLNALIYLMHKNPLPGLIVDRAQNHRIIDVNQKALLLYEFSKPEITAKYLHEISLTNQSILAINDFYQHNIPINPIKTQHVTKTKKVIDVEVFLTLLDDYVFIQIKPEEEGFNNKEQLKHYKQQYLNLLNSMITGYARHKIIQDENGKPIDYRFLEINPAFLKTTDKSAGQFIGKTVLQIWPDLDSFWIEKYGEVALEGKQIDFEQYANNLDKHFHVFAYSPIPGEFITIFVDITEYKKQQIILQEQQDLFKDLTDHIDEIFWVRDKKTLNYIYVTPNYEKFYNEPVENLYQEENSFLKWVHPEDLPMVKTHFEALISKNKAYDIQYRIHQKEKIRWVRSRAYPIYDENLVITRFGGVVQDVTEQKLFHEQLQQYTHEREQDLSILYQVAYIANHQTGMVIEIQNLLETICQTTKAFASLLVFADKQVIIEKPMITFPERFAEIIESNLSDISAIFSFSWQEKQKILSGKEFPEIPFLPDDQILITPLVLSETNYGYLFFIFHPDVEITTGHTTLILAVADQLVMVLENLNLRNLIKKNAVVEERQRISRELHDSVTQSLYSLNLISQAGLDRLEEQELEEVRECLNEIQSNAVQSLKEMRLLLYELHPPILEEAGLIKAIQNRLNFVERKTNIQVDFKYQEKTHLPTSLQAELYRIIIEALNNILKHARANYIDLSVLIDLIQVKINITDNGVGFDVSAAEKYGYGLTAMKERAQKINAQIKIKSQQDFGTTITIECLL